MRSSEAASSWLDWFPAWRQRKMRPSQSGRSTRARKSESYRPCNDFCILDFGRGGTAAIGGALGGIGGALIGTLVVRSSGPTPGCPWPCPIVRRH